MATHSSTPRPVTVDLGYRPRPWQADCHRQMKRFSVLVLHRRAGKTRLAIAHLMAKALKAGKSAGGDNPSFAYLAPYLKQAKLLAWELLKRNARLIPGSSINEAEASITLPNQATIRVFGADNPDALRGNGFDGVVLDELKDTKPEVWYEIVRPALSDRKGWALFLGTPKGINLLSELYNFGKTQSDWFTAIYTVYETNALPKEEIESLKASMSENEFNREFLCDFSAAGEDQLISISEVEAACQRHLRADQYESASLIMGCDPARFGDDASVIVFRQGLKCEDPIEFRGLDNMQFAAKIATQIEERHPDAVFIDVGNGSGVIDRLRQLGHDVVEVNFGGKADSDRYVNKRTEMWHGGTKAWIAQGGVLPKHTGMKQDLATPTFYYNDKNQICLESKDDIKKRLQGRSTDCGDGLGLTFAFRVTPNRDPYAAMRNSSARVRRTADYNPLEAD